jgi:hypothetical protein
MLAIRGSGLPEEWHMRSYSVMRTPAGGFLGVTVAGLALLMLMLVVAAFY